MHIHNYNLSQGTIGIQGKENLYQYAVYPIVNHNSRFDNNVIQTATSIANNIKISGNYVFLRPNDLNGFAPIYFGITDDLSRCFYNHDKMDSIKDHGVTHIGFHINNNEANREAEEKDLLEKHETHCILSKRN